MIDSGKLRSVLDSYRKDFVTPDPANGNQTGWEKEKYKWVAVQHFQSNWDIDAPDFAEMFKEAMSKTNNLLASMNYFPREMIIDFAKAAPEETREMFRALFNEEVSVVDRVKAFIDEAERIRSKYGANEWHSHYQNVNSVSTYLWLRYPDKYYIYKYSECKQAAAVLGSDFKVKKGAKPEVLIGFFAFYDEISAFLSTDTATVNLLKQSLTDECYADPMLRTLTIDVGFYISRYYVQAEPKEKDKGHADQTVERAWFVGASDDSTDYTDTFVSEGRWENLWSNGNFSDEVNSMAVGDRIVIKSTYTRKNVPFNAGGKVISVLGIKAIGTVTGNRQDGKNLTVSWERVDPRREWYDSCIYRDTVHLVRASDGPNQHALLRFVFDRVPQDYAPIESKYAAVSYWWLNANPAIWSLSDLAVGAERAYTLLSDNGHKRRIYQNFLDAKAGDMIIGYESTPVKQVVAVGKISREQDGEKIYFEKVEGLATPIDYQTLRDCKELENMEYFRQPQGSLFRLTREEFDVIMDLIRDANPAQEKTEAVKKYTKQDFLQEVYMSDEQYDSLISLLKNKSNLILQGAPGVGKTFAAKRLAYAIMGEKDDSRIEFVQFHQNYSYEDFMMGYRPSEKGFELKYGIFYRFCMQAANHPDQEYFFIIDEINRGNMSKIFGELLMLIEKDYRGTKSTLAYNGMAFSVPENLYLIGMMNTADRSLAMIDYALRRRFSFYTMVPGFDSQGFKTYQESLHNAEFDRLMAVVKSLNDAIANDPSLGSGFCIGHSYFCGHEAGENDRWIKEAVDYDLIPMLNEYWFDDPDRVAKWSDLLSGVFHG